MNKNSIILSTKKLLLNQKQVLHDANFHLIEEDFIETKIKNFELAKLYNNLIFTSQNAVNSILNNSELEQLKTKNVFCVGLKTKELLEKNGFTVSVYTGYGSDLAEIISLIYNDEKFTFFCGNLRRDELPKMLEENGVIFNEIRVYETKITSKKITERVNGILFFSPSAVESYLQENKISNERCFAIGTTTAQALEEKKIKNIEIAEKPTIESVIERAITIMKRI
jgi:uroporphyrinogen-III synthase